MSAIILILVVALGVMVVYLIRQRRKGRRKQLPAGFRELLAGHVGYYRRLDEAGKARFEERVKEFLSYVQIHGVGTEVTLLDQLLVASSAVIPVFGFERWRYYNLHDVLLYGESFARENFSMRGGDRDTSGMVGSGALQQIMILSKPSLHEGFGNRWAVYNTGIHEFVHLLDKADGETDGRPEQLLQKELLLQWVECAERETEAIRSGNSEIDPYAATARAEFLAVTAEYFFQRPDLLREKHPELFTLLTRIFLQEPSYAG